MGTSFKIWRLPFRWFFIINTLYPSLLAKHCVGCLQPFAEVTKLFIRAVFQLVVVFKTASSV
jgi:hypothetical protein